MSGKYNIVWRNWDGTQFAPRIDDFVHLEYALKVNEIGSMVLRLPATHYDRRQFKRWHMFEIWRGIEGLDGQHLEGDTAWIVRRSRYVLDDAGKKYVQLDAFSMEYILEHSIVAYDAGSAEAEKSDFADDMMKEIFFENRGLGAIDPLRDLSNYVSIQSDQSLGMPVEKAFSRQKLLSTFQDIARNSWEQGIFIAFGIIRLDLWHFQFKTWAYQRGLDRSIHGTNQLLFGPKYGNLGSYEDLDDAYDENNYIYVGGQGQEDDREIVEVGDAARTNLSPFNRMEVFLDARQDAQTTTLTDDGNAALKAGEPKHIVSGSIRETPNCLYGIHWGWGDKVTIETDTDKFDAYLNSIAVTVDKGEGENIETIDAGISSDYGLGETGI